MKLRFTLLAGFAMGCIMICPVAPAFSQTGVPDSGSNDTSAQQPVIDAVQSYVDAFNRRDAAALSQHWSESGTWVGDDGAPIQGRENIQQAFQALLGGLADDQRLTVNVRKVTLVTDNVAIEEGSASLTGGSAAEYTAIHKLEDGKWKLHSIKEHGDAPRVSNSRHLQGLAWMIGDWVDQSDDATIESSCRWSKNGNFITKNFRVTIPGLDTLEGTQVIGFDASTQSIRSWMFDSDGGHATGVWTQRGDAWAVRSSQVLADGRRAFSTNVFTPLDADRFQWKSIGRDLGGETLPDIDSVEVVRVRESE